MDTIRDALFVGRKNEVELLESLLADTATHRFAYVQGMGGMGKSELLRRFGSIAQERGWAIHRVDSRNLPPVIEVVQSALLAASADMGPCVLFLDTFEMLAPIEREIREQLLPALPDHQRLVIAGRGELDAGWRSDAGWTELAHVIDLDELSTSEAKRYLQKRLVEAQLIESVVETIGGFPLALALSAEALSHEESSIEALDDPRFMDTFLEQALDRAPTKNHQVAMMVAAVVFHTTEDLLGHVVGVDSARELFDWLCRRPYFRSDANGIVPHDMIRSALLSHIRWKNPSLLHEVLLGAGRYYYDVLRYQRSFPEVVPEANFLFGHTDWTPFDAEGMYRVRYVPAREQDWPLIEELVRAQIGKEALSHLRRWRSHPAFVFYAVLRGDGPLEGFFSGIRGQKLGVDEMRRIPGPAQILEELGKPKGPWSLGWLWGDRRHKQGLSSTNTCYMNWIAIELLREPHMSLCGTITDDKEGWPHIGFPRTKPRVADECAFTIDGIRFIPLLKELQGMSPSCWFWLMFEEWLEAMSMPRAPSVASSGELLDQLKPTLKDADRPDRLTENSLIDLCLVSDRAEGGNQLQRAKVLVAVLRELCAEFRNSSRDELYSEILERTYFSPTGKQRAIAADLGMSFSSYRRHLAVAIDRLAEGLHQHELIAREGSDGGV